LWVVPPATPPDTRICYTTHYTHTTHLPFPPRTAHALPRTHDHTQYIPPPRTLTTTWRTHTSHRLPPLPRAHHTCLPYAVYGYRGCCHHLRTPFTCLPPPELHHTAPLHAPPHLQYTHTVFAPLPTAAHHTTCCCDYATRCATRVPLLRISPLPFGSCAILFAAAIQRTHATSYTTGCLLEHRMRSASA